jgi:hypothetical protein
MQQTHLGQIDNDFTASGDGGSAAIIIHSVLEVQQHQVRWSVEFHNTVRAEKLALIFDRDVVYSNPDAGLCFGPRVRWLQGHDEQLLLHLLWLLHLPVLLGTHAVTQSIYRDSHKHHLKLRRDIQAQPTTVT